MWNTPSSYLSKAHGKYLEEQWRAWITHETPAKRRGGDNPPPPDNCWKAVAHNFNWHSNILVKPPPTVPQLFCRFLSLIGWIGWYTSLFFIVKSLFCVPQHGHVPLQLGHAWPALGKSISRPRRRHNKPPWLSRAFSTWHQRHPYNDVNKVDKWLARWAGYPSR